MKPSMGFWHAPNVSGLIRQARFVVSTPARILWLFARGEMLGQGSSITTPWQEFVLALNFWVAFCRECKIRALILRWPSGE